MNISLSKHPKLLMSITELVQMGYSKADLKNYIRIKGFPCIRTQGGGKYLIETDKLDAWIVEYQAKIAKAREINSRRLLRFRTM